MKRSFIIRSAVMLLAFLAGGITASAQYNPENPPDPSPQSTLYKVSVSTEPADAGYPSGAGSYTPGMQVYIYASPNYNYEFKYWRKVGSEGVYSEYESFTYTMEEKDVSFVAVYAKKPYNPENPSDPISDNSYRLFLDCSPQGACSFNRTSGEKVESGTNVEVSAYPNQWYEFQGWYENDVLVSSEMYFQYQMKPKNCTLVAKFKKNYNPGNPEDPNTPQTDIDNPTNVKGDANWDGKVNVADIVAIINARKGNPPARYSAENANADGLGEVNQADIEAIVDIIMNR